MPRPVGYGRPGTKVIPDDWGVTQGRVWEGTFEATVTVGAPGGTPGRNSVTRQTETTPVAPIYTGPASVSPDVEVGAEPTIGEDQVPLRGYLVELPHTVTAAAAGMVVTVSSCPLETALEGRRLIVTTVEYDPRRFTRILHADLAE
jgi:hypothetical protein